MLRQGRRWYPALIYQRAYVTRYIVNMSHISSIVVQCRPPSHAHPAFSIHRFNAACLQKHVTKFTVSEYGPLVVTANTVCFIHVC